MTYLVACLGGGKGTWAHLARLSAGEQWEKIFLITSEEYAGKFDTGCPHEYIVIDLAKTMKELSQDIMQKLKGKVPDLEVALSIVSGTGKEHMAIISALTKLGLGIRLVALAGEKVDEL